MDQCPNCGVSSPAGGRFCSYCGQALDGGTAYAPPPPDLTCPACGTENAADAAFCNQCGSSIPQSAHSDAAVHAAISSSGRRPYASATGTDPASRAAFLAGLGQDAPRPWSPGADGLIGRLAEAERHVELCEADWYAASDALRSARADAPEGTAPYWDELAGQMREGSAAGRHLAPEARSRYVAYLTAEQTARRAEQAWEAAKATRAVLLGQWSGVLDDVSVAATERAQDRAFRERRR